MNSKKSLAFLATTISTKLRIPPSPSQCRFYSSPPSPTSSNKLFVGGLSWSVDEKSLKDVFSSFGDVTEVRIVYDKDSGRSRGFGFVIFSNEDDANCAKDAMDGKALLGRPLRINYAFVYWDFWFRRGNRPTSPKAKQMIIFKRCGSYKLRVISLNAGFYVWKQQSVKKSVLAVQGQGFRQNHRETQLGGYAKGLRRIDS